MSANAGPSTPAEYVFHGGDRGRDRLRVLARVTAPTTRELFARLGVGAGWRCLDLGCGGGDVTIDLATLVHPAMVVGVDADTAQLAIARREARVAGVDNVEYRFGDAISAGPPLGERYDLGYARFLLTHLPTPETALDRLVACVRPGGLVAVEDIDTEASFCEPPSPAYDRYVDWYGKASRARGGDPTIGRRLPTLLHGAGIVEIDVRIVQPAGIAGDISRIAPLTLAATAESIVAGRIASAAEVERLQAELEVLSAEGRLVTMPRVVQAWGVRPTPI